MNGRRTPPVKSAPIFASTRCARSAQQRLQRGTPALGTWRVIIVDALDDLNRAAANALLKNLEEPPPATLFLGLSHSPGRLLPTLRSRCRTLRLQPLADADVARILEQVMPDASVAERAALVTIANGSPGQALRFAGAGIEKLAAELASLAAATAAQATARAFALAKGLAAKPAAPRYEAFLELAPSYIATAARSRSGARLARALGLWDKAHALGSAALGLSLDPQSVVFELSTLVAGLADK